MARKSPTVLKSYAPKTRICHFIVYGKASPAGSKTTGVSKSGKRFVRDSSKGSYQWKADIKEKAASVMNGEALTDEPLAVWFHFYKPRPKGHFNAKGELNAKGLASPFPIVKPDVLKLARAAEDALTGIVYRGDEQIVEEHIAKDWGEPARVVIEVLRRI